MHRIDNATSSDTLPALESPGPIVNGYFKTHTKLTHAWLNAIQEEICYVIEEAGLTLDKNDRTQLYDAIQLLIASGPSSPAINSVEEDTSPKLGGHLIVNDFDITSETDGDVIFSTSNNINLNGNVLVHTNIVHDGDTNNLVSFGTNTQTFQVNGATMLDISSSGLRLGGANSRVNTIANETDFASNSNTALTTQYAFKSYVDNLFDNIEPGDVTLAPIYINISSADATPDYIGWGVIAWANYNKFSYGNLHKAFICPISGSIKNFYINLKETNVDLSSGTLNITLTIYKNFASTGVTFNYNGAYAYGTEINFSNLVNTISISAGDEISIRATVSSGTFSGGTELKGGISFLYLE